MIRSPVENDEECAFTSFLSPLAVHAARGLRRAAIYK